MEAYLRWARPKGFVDVYKHLADIQPLFDDFHKQSTVTGPISFLKRYPEHGDISCFPKANDRPLFRNGPITRPIEDPTTPGEVPNNYGPGDPDVP